MTIWRVDPVSRKYPPLRVLWGIPWLGVYYLGAALIALAALATGGLYHAMQAWRRRP